MKVLQVSSEYPCPRSSKIAIATGWDETVCRRLPSAFPDAFKRVTWRPDATGEWFRDQVAQSDADVIMFNVELYSSWLMPYLRDGAGDRILISNVHDVTAARTGYVPDVDERDVFDMADALIFTQEEQAVSAKAFGFNIDKPTFILPNYPSSTMFVDKPLLPYIGGIVYEGGLDPRGAEGAWRDLSPIADFLESEGSALHIYPANPGIDYGRLYDMVLDYRVLIHHLARHDWGISGTAVPELSWFTTSPNKVFDYMSAGIPFIALNTPNMKPWAEEGLGICIDSLDYLKDMPDTKPFVKAIKANRGRFTMERMAPKLEAFVRGLL